MAPAQQRAHIFEWRFQAGEVSDNGRRSRLLQRRERHCRRPHALCELTVGVHEASQPGVDYVGAHRINLEELCECEQRQRVVVGQPRDGARVRKLYCQAEERVVAVRRRVDQERKGDGLAAVARRLHRLLQNGRHLLRNAVHVERLRNDQKYGGAVVLNAHVACIKKITWPLTPQLLLTLVRRPPAALPHDTSARRGPRRRASHPRAKNGGVRQASLLPLPLPLLPLEHF